MLEGRIHIGQTSRQLYGGRKKIQAVGGWRSPKASRRHWHS